MKRKFINVTKEYQAIGSKKLTNLIEDSIKIYGGNISFDREKRWKILEELSEEKLSELDKLSDRYYEIEREEWGKVPIWVKSNSDKFLIQGEIDDYS